MDNLLSERDLLKKELDILDKKINILDKKQIQMRICMLELVRLSIDEEDEDLYLLVQSCPDYGRKYLGLINGKKKLGIIQQAFLKYYKDIGREVSFSYFCFGHNDSKHLYLEGFPEHMF